MPRSTSGYRIVETWDTLGMRATRSDDTILEGAFVPDRYVARVVLPDLPAPTAFVLGVFGWASRPSPASTAGSRRGPWTWPLPRWEKRPRWPSAVGP